MHRTNRRRSAARVFGWGLVAVVYATVLVWAGSLTAGESAASAAQPVAGTITLAAREVGEEVASTAAAELPREAPLVTLALAVGIIALAGGAYAVHAIRSRQPRRVSATRLVVRHITTLH